VTGERLTHNSRIGAVKTAGSASFSRVVARLVVFVLALSCGDWAQEILAQQHPSATRAGLESIQIRPNVHVIFGAGGNVTVHVGEDGIVVVDSGSAETARALLDAIKAISSVAQGSGSARIPSATATTQRCSPTRTSSSA